MVVSDRKVDKCGTGGGGTAGGGGGVWRNSGWGCAEEASGPRKQKMNGKVKIKAVLSRTVTLVNSCCFDRLAIAVMVSMVDYSGMRAAQSPAHLQHVCCTEMLGKY